MRLQGSIWGMWVLFFLIAIFRNNKVNVLLYTLLVYYSIQYIKRNIDKVSVADPTEPVHRRR